jgi:hypothetical protein
LLVTSFPPRRTGVKNMKATSQLAGKPDLLLLFDRFPHEVRRAVDLSAATRDVVGVVRDSGSVRFVFAPHSLVEPPRESRSGPIQLSRTRGKFLEFRERLRPFARIVVLVPDEKAL